MMHLGSSTIEAVSARCSTASSTPAAAFFTALYGNIAGYIELRAGVNQAIDPRHIDLVPLNESGEWFAYHPGRVDALCTAVSALVTRYGNVYVSEHVYKRPNRAAVMKPGRAIVIEDAPLGTSCSFFVQTSPTSGHAHFIVDHDTPPHILHDLSRRGAAALGGDPSGADLQQLVRVPDTVNTKATYGGDYVVTWSGDTGRRYTGAELETQWPILTISTNIALDDVNVWNGNRGDLLNDAGLPRRWKNLRVPGWRVLRGDLVPPSTSEARYIVVSSLVTHGYPDAEILVLARQLADFDASTRKGSAWLDTDILRCIGKARARYPVLPTPTRTRGTQPSTPLPMVPPVRRGRTTTLTPTALLAFYEQERSFSNVVLLTVSAVAERLQVSRATIERCERVLRTEGHIERRCCNRRQASLVVLQRPLTNTEVAQSLACIDDRTPPVVDSRPITHDAEHVIPVATHVPSSTGQIPHHYAENMAERCIGGTHPPDGTPAQPCPSLRAAIADAFDHLSHRPRITRQMLVMVLESKYPDLVYTPAALDRCIAAERQQRGWAQQVDDLRTMPYAQLQRLSRKLDRLLVDGPTESRGGQYGWACAMVAHVSAELERRASMNERASPRKLRQQREEYLWLATNARRTLTDAAPRTARPMERARTGVCSSATRSAQPSLFDMVLADTTPAAQLIANLYRLRAERHGDHRATATDDPWGDSS